MVTDKQKQNLKLIEKGEIKNPNWRPKKFVGSVLDELKKQGFGNITRRNVVDIYETLLSLPRDGLVDIASGKQYPMIYRIVAKEMLSKRGFDVIEKMIDRAHGKASQTVDVVVQENPLKELVNEIREDLVGTTGENREVKKP